MAKKRRSKVRKVITLLVTASLVAGGGYVGYQKYTETKAAEPSGQSDTESISAPVVKTAQATKGTIASTVVGSGTLSDGDSEDVTIPTGITIDQVLVERAVILSRRVTRLRPSIRHRLQVRSLPSRIRSARSTKSSRTLRMRTMTRR